MVASTMAQSYENKDVEINGKEIENYSSSDGGNGIEQPSPEELSTLKGKKLDFDHGDFPWRDVSIRDPDSGAVKYFADVSVFKKHVPDVTLHAQAEKGPLVGTSSFSWSRSIKCGLGLDESSMQWVEMKRSGLMSVNKFQFEYGGKTYSASRTRDAEHGVSGMKKITLRHYKVVDEASGKAVAYYVSDAKPGKRKGTLTLEAGVGQNLEVLVVLAVVSLREKSRRRMARSAGAAGGSSG